jgi:hypothetical protein
VSSLEVVHVAAEAAEAAEAGEVRDASRRLSVDIRTIHVRD